MKKVLRTLSIGIGILSLLIFLLSIIYWGWYLKMSLPNHARNLPWSFEEGSRIYNERIKAEYTDGMSAFELTRKLQEKGYEVLVVAEQEKEEEKPYCAITWWLISLSQNNLDRITSDMGSHYQICSKTKEMQMNYKEGTSLTELTKKLQENNFKVKMSASIKRVKLACGITWNITWTENEKNEADDIVGEFRYNCL